MALQEGTVLQGGTNYKIQGDRVIILLDEAKDHTITESGIVIPLQKLTESDAGRIKTELTNRKHYLQGTILQIGALAAKKLEESLVDVLPGDRVYVSQMALSTAGYQFYPDRTKLVSDFEGFVCVPHSMIEAKIID